MKFRTRLMVLITIFTTFFALVLPSTVSADPRISDAPTVCQDKAGVLKSGEIDVLVLLDNSGSLIKDRTDPSGLRFQALDEFIENFSNLSNSKKNFGLIKFALIAEEVFPIQALNSSNSAEFQKLIKNGVTNPDGATNYIGAFKLAMEKLSARPENNCKILIWFTDGGYQIEKAKTDIELAELEEAFCSETGFVSTIQNLDINTFVVFLGDGLSDDKDTQERNDKSIDVMQVITGDLTPSIKGVDSREVTSESEICKARFDSGSRHLGEVVSTEEASDLLGYLADIVNIVDGGKTVTFDECPILASSFDTVPIPSGWFVDWLSITSWDGNFSSDDPLDSRLRIKIDGQDQPFTQFFDPIAAQDLTRVLRFKVKDGKQSELKPGWVLHAEGIGRVCIRVKPLEVKFRFQGDNKIPLSPGNLPAEFFNDGQLTCALNDALAECSSASGEGLSGKIEVQNGSVFSSDGTLPVAIEINDVPILIDDRCVVTLTGEHVASDKFLFTTTCEVFPALNTDFFLATDLLKQLEECGIGSWSVTIDGKPTDVLKAGDESVQIGVSTVNAPENINKSCEILGGSISFKAIADGKGSLPIIQSTIDFDLIKKANFLLAVIFALGATLAVSLLSLLLLRAVNVVTSKTVAAQDLFGYETSFDLVPGQFKRGEFNFAGGNSRAFVADFDTLQQITGNSQQTSLNFGSISLLRQLPRFTKPFEESRLVLKSAAAAVFWKANSASDGLNMTFSKALILSTTETRPPSAESPVKATLSVLVPKRGFGAGVDGVQQLVRERGDELAAELYELLVSRHGASTSSDSQSSPLTGGSAVERGTGIDATNKLQVPSSTPNEFQTPPNSSKAGDSDGASTTKPPQPPRPPQPPQPPKRII